MSDKPKAKAQSQPSPKATPTVRSNKKSQKGNGNRTFVSIAVVVCLVALLAPVGYQYALTGEVPSIQALLSFASGPPVSGSRPSRSPQSAVQKPKEEQVIIRVVPVGRRKSLQLGDLLDLLPEADTRYTCGVPLRVRPAADDSIFVSYESIYTEGQTKPASNVIPWNRVDDGFCDCADGTDEPTTGACSLFATTSDHSVHSTLQFECLLDRIVRVPYSRLHDGIPDCCDRSDEGVFPPTADDIARCTQVHATRIHNAKISLQMTLTGHKEYQHRAEVGLRDFEPEFQKNLTASIQTFENAKQSMSAIIMNVTKDLRRQFEARVAQHAAAMGADSEEFAKRRKQEEGQMQAALKQYNMQIRQQLSQLENEAGRHQVILDTQALGPSFEYAPLYTVCLNATVHEKILKGGSAIPEQHYVLFQVCPFRYLLQQTLTPTFILAMEELSVFGITADFGGYFAIPEGAQRDPKVPEQVWTRLAEIRQTIRATLLGIWTGFTGVDGFDQVIPQEQEDGPPIPPHKKNLGEPVQQVSLFEYGEACALLEGKHREGRVRFVCGDKEDHVVTVEEQGICDYSVVVSSPSACDNAAVAAAEEVLRIGEEAERQFLETIKPRSAKVADV